LIDPCPVRCQNDGNEQALYSDLCLHFKTGMR
jgi:hypothetical protein